jgi:hypothetical protein
MGMNNDLRWFLTRSGLEADAKLAASVAPSVKTAGRNRVGECEETLCVALARVESFAQFIELLFEHDAEALSANVSSGVTIKTIAHRLVVRRNGFRHCSRHATHEKKQRDTSWPPPISANVP